MVSGQSRWSISGVLAALASTDLALSVQAYFGPHPALVLLGPLVAATAASSFAQLKQANSNGRPPMAQFGGSCAPLGPGFIAGASDDDPAGIGTYSQAGAQFGFGIGWTMLVTYPLMSAIQQICARIGRTTGHGIAGNLCRHYPAWLLYLVVALLFTANTINIGADLSAMADALKLLIGGPSTLYVVAFGSICAFASVYIDYDRYVAVLKWLTLSLFSYVAALFVVNPPWVKP